VHREYDEFSKGLKSFSVATNGFLGSPVIVSVAGTAFHLCTNNRLMSEVDKSNICLGKSGPKPVLN